MEFSENGSSSEQTRSTLKISDQIGFDLPKDIVFPDELNKYLRDQIQQLLHENGMTKKHLAEEEAANEMRKKEISMLQSKLKEYEKVNEKNPYSSAHSLTSSKIVELSRKLREKNSEIITLQTKCSKVEKQLQEVESKVAIAEEQEKSPDKKDESTLKQEDNQIKKLQEKLSVTSLKLAESKNLNIQLKNELKLANKYLQQEVGDNLENLSNCNVNWRGRAQIICDLQQKNLDLKDKLRAYQGKAGATPIPSVTKNDKKIENLTKENANLRANLEDLKKKMDASRARCKVLESDCIVFKTKLSSVNIQFDRDQKLLESLTEQIGNQQETKAEALKQKDRIIKGLQKDNEVLKIELQKQKCLIENLNKDLHDKQDEVRDIMKYKKSSRPSSSYGHKPGNIDEKAVNRLEAERLRLLQLTEMQNMRIESERDLHMKTQNQLRMERQKAAKLEGSLARLELEHSSSRGYSTTQTSIKSMERDSLVFKDQLELAEEQIKAYKTRLEIEQQERKKDFQEFTHILQGYSNSVL